MLKSDNLAKAYVETKKFMLAGAFGLVVALLYLVVISREKFSIDLANLEIFIKYKINLKF